MSSATQTEEMFELARVGARKVLAECLALKAGDLLALFWDETTAIPARVLVEVAGELDIDVRERRVSLREQAEFSPQRGLSLEDKEALEAARGIITLISNQIAGTGYRTELLKYGTDGGRRLGHMPGGNLSVLAHAVNIDYEQAVERCDDLALALTLGRTVRLETYVPGAGGRRERACELKFGIAGRVPITSTGIIPIGTWGNLPGGETFIAPEEDTAEGTFVLNGAFKDFVLRPPAYVLLHFNAGRLTDIEGTSAATARFRLILDYGRAHGGEHYNALAELGIGVNPSIKELTGNGLFDEKCYGTAHVAIGDSTRYGGRNAARIHEDLITRAPSLWIDDKPILTNGADTLDPRDWRETLAQVSLAPELCAPTTLLTRTGNHARSTADGRLRVLREVAAGRACIYTIGEAATSRTLTQLYEHVPLLPQQITLQEFYESVHQALGLDQASAAAALAILLRHCVVKLNEA